MPLKERRTIVKKDEKDAGSRRWNALMSLASFELGFLALNLRSRDCSWRVDTKGMIVGINRRLVQ